MSTDDNASRVAAMTLGGLGVLAFSVSLPATRVAVEDLDPALVGLGRAVVAALLAAAVLAVLRQPVPSRALWPRLAGVGIGVIVGFPLLTSFALRDRTSAHAAVVVGLLPAATAAWAVWRGGERPSPRFWVAAGAGLVCVLAFAATQGASGLRVSDLLILGAVILGGYGYAEGGALARSLGGWQVICWALVLALPVLAPVVAALLLAGADHSGGAAAWAGFAYVSAVSMFLGFFAWYAGLARGGIARIGQLQLAQPVLTLGWAALLLGETVTPVTGLAAVAVLASVAATQRARVGRAQPVPVAA